MSLILISPQDHMRQAGDVCFSQVFRDGSGKMQLTLLVLFKVLYDMVELETVWSSFLTIGSFHDMEEGSGRKLIIQLEISRSNGSCAKVPCF